MYTFEKVWNVNEALPKPEAEEDCGIEISIQEEKHKPPSPVSKTEGLLGAGVPETDKSEPKTKFKIMGVIKESKLYRDLRNSLLVSSKTRLFTKLMKYQIGGFEAERRRHLSTFPETIHPFGDFR